MSVCLRRRELARPRRRRDAFLPTLTNPPTERMSQERPSHDRPTGDAGPAEALRRAFRFALGGERSIETERLRGAACAYVRELREQGVTPEGAIVSVKDVLRRAVMGHTPTHDSRREADSMLERVVTWCIDEYYRPASSPD